MAEVDGDAGHVTGAGVGVGIGVGDAAASEAAVLQPVVAQAATAVAPAVLMAVTKAEHWLLAETAPLTVREPVAGRRVSEWVVAAWRHDGGTRGAGGAAAH